MRLKDLIKDIYPQNQISPRFLEEDIESLCIDSRRAKQGSLFIALKGARDDGEKFIDDAIKNGARIVVKTGSLAIDAAQDICILTVPDTRRFFQQILRRFYGNPSEKIKVIGITGTNGKTTMTYLLESIFQIAGKRCGVIGTINYRLGSRQLVAKNTTPGPVDIQNYLTAMVKEGMDYCAMEVSSHALVQGRVEGIEFHTAVFTNLTSDHLDYHKNREDYFQAKALLFSGLSAQAIAIINNDDPLASRLAAMTRAATITYGIKGTADVVAQDIKLDFKETTFVLKAFQKEIPISTKLVGLHNVYNILAAAAVCIKENISLDHIKEGVDHLITVPGRMEPIDCGQDFHVFVDYAHTEDALRNILLSVRNISNAKIILVFGCGGDRDKTKRSKMGNVASVFADFVILTNDNPRSEDPRTIVEEILLGFDGDHYEVIMDRDQAIKEALHRAKTGDVVIIGGKGHEDYQIFKDETVPFDERRIVKNHLEEIIKALSTRAPEHQSPVKK